MAALVKIARPDVGLITNAGAEHLEGFGDLDGVARAEGEMVAGLAADGIAVINADDAYASLWRGMSRARVVSFGIDSAADFRATEMHECLKEAGFHVTYTLASPQGSAQGAAQCRRPAQCPATRWPRRRQPVQPAPRRQTSSPDWAPCSRSAAACSPGARSRARG